MKFIAALGAVVFAALALPQAAFAQLNENCTVSVLNRNVRVNPDGSWVLPNIPANFGQVKARATCVQNGVTTFGESAFFTLPSNGVVNLPDIVLNAVTPIPSSIAISPTPLNLTSAGQTIQLTITATYPDGSTGNVSASSTGTNYTSSNPAIATVSPDGMVTAVASGVAILQATNDGAAGIVRAIVALSTTDTDGDGIPDDVELSLGLDPTNPVDAQEDFDRDDLTNLEEYRLGADIRNADTDGDGLSDSEEVNLHETSPLLADTDGDIIPDGVEVQTGTNPLNAASYDLKKAAASSVVTPASFVLTTSTVFPNASLLLNWKVTLIDGKTILDLTADPRTAYASSNIFACNFGSQKGRIFAGAPGDCMVTLRNGTLTAGVPGTVQAFTPAALSFFNIPGGTNDVAVSGGFAYVATNTAGLRIVDVHDRAHPAPVASVALPAPALDVAVENGLAYVAVGGAGLQIIDVSNPLNPAIVGSFDTAGSAVDVVVKEGRAYLTDTSAFVILDVSVPDEPSLIGSISLTNAIGVDVDVARNIAVIARAGNGLTVVDISDPASPAVLGNLSGGNVRDVALSGNFAFLADMSRSFTSVDISNPAAPILMASTPQSTGGLLVDVALNDGLAAGADIFFVNGVPLIDISAPSTPQPRLILNFSAFGDDNATGIDMDAGFVYLTTDRSRLLIGQYNLIQDTFGIPPSVEIVSPTPGTPVIHGATVTVTANAVDDVGIAAVAFFLNGQATQTDTNAPFQYTFTAPASGSSLTLGAIATDLGGNSAEAPLVTLNLIPDPLTRVTGLVLDTANNPVAGVTVSVAGRTALTAGNGTFGIDDVPTVQGTITVTASFVEANGTKLGGRSATVAPIYGGTTPVGNIVLRPIPVISSINPRYAFPGETAAFSVMGTNLTGSAFAFNPTGRLTIGSVNVAADGASATFSVAAVAGSSGQFVLLASNAVGTSDPASTKANTVTVPANPEADTDGDGFVDGLELVLGSDPFDRDSIPLVMASGTVFSQPVVVLNSAAPFSVTPTQLTSISAPVVVKNSIAPVPEPGQPQTLLSTPVVVQNATAPLTEPGQPQTLISTPVVIQNVTPPAALQATIVSAAVLIDNSPTAPTPVTFNPPDDSGPGGAAGDVEVEVTASGLTEGSVRVVEGQTFLMRFAAKNADVGRVEFRVNDVPYATDASAPFEVLLTAPAVLKSLKIEATLIAPDDREIAARTFNFIIDAPTPTTVSGRVTGENGQPIAGATVNIVVDGLRAEFFDLPNLAALPDLSAAAPASTGVTTAINFRNTQTALGVDPIGTQSAPDYAARFTGFLRVPQDGSYRFMLAVDAGGRLKIGESTSIEIPTGTGALQTGTADVTLTAGLVPIELTFYQGVGNTELQLSWIAPGGEPAVIRPEFFAAMPPALAATTDAAGNFRIENIPSSIGRVQLVGAAAVAGTPYVGRTNYLPLTQAEKEPQTLVLAPQ